jgi:hypothetical protein
MRYVTRRAPAKQWYSEDLGEECQHATTITVFEVGDEVEPTGLIDRHGHNICRVKATAGFITHG